VSNLLNII